MLVLDSIMNSTMNVTGHQLICVFIISHLKICEYSLPFEIIVALLFHSICLFFAITKRHVIIITLEECDEVDVYDPYEDCRKFRVVSKAV